MPDLAGRTKHEMEMATAAYLVLRRFGDTFDDDDGFDMFGFREQMEEALVPTIAAVYEDAGSNLAKQQGADLGRFKIDVKSVRWGTKYSRKLAREVSRSVRDELETASRLEDPIEYAARVNDIFGRTRAEKIAVTEVTSGISTGERSVLDEIARQTGKTLMAYWQTEVSGVCKICKGLRNKSESVWRRKFPFGPPAHPWCVPSDGLVVPMGKLAAASKAFYVGDCVETRLSNGARFTVTKNHPVLTRRGWVAAEALDLSDEIAYTSHPERVAAAIDPDHSYVETSVEQAFCSLVKATSVASSGVPSTSEQFHGDGASMQGEIEIVRADGQFPREADSFNHQHFLERFLDLRLGFISALGRSLLPQFFGRNHSPANSRMRSVEHGQLLLVGRGDPPQSHRFGTGTRLDAGLFKNRGHRCSTNAAGLGEQQHAGSFEEQTHDGLTRQTRSQQGLLGLGAEMRPQPLQLPSQSSWLDLQLAREFVHRFTSEVAFLRVAEVRPVFYRGHVYDLQCPEFDLYSCNGAIVHNCRCWLLYR